MNLRVDISFERQEGLIIEMARTFSCKIIPSAYRQYLKLSGLVSDNVIYKPFQVVKVPVELIQESISPYPEYYLDWLEKDRLVETPAVETVRKQEILWEEDIRFVGKITGGDWDLVRQRVESLISYIAFKERFLEGKSWEETLYYQFLKRKVRTARENNLELPFPDGFDHSRSSEYYFDYYLGKLKYWEELYYQIKENGYKSQAAGNTYPRSLHSRKASYEGWPENEVEIAVARDGELLFVDGRHRLIIAKLLEIEEIPVIVNLWHREFIDRVKSETGQKRITPAEAIGWLFENRGK